MITLGGLTNDELGFKVLKVDTMQPALPATRDYLTEISGRHGSYDFGADLSARVYLLSCYFPAAVTPAEIQAAIRVLNAHLLDAWGKPETMTLYFDAEPDKYYNVRYSGSQTIDTSAAMARRQFTLPLVAFDPHAYAAEVEDEDDITTSPQALNYTVVSGLNVPLTIILDNEGAGTIAGFTFKTYDEIFDWSVYA